MILLTSAAYIHSDMQVEFGKMPPSFLPLGGMRLYRHQIQFLTKLKKTGEKIVVSVPEDFEIPELDCAFFQSNSVEVVKVPHHLSLAESIYFCTNALAMNERLLILHGDTLFTGDVQFSAPDYFSAQNDLDVYDRGYVTGVLAQKKEEYFTGLFQFSDGIRFRQCLNGMSFEDAANAYFKTTHTQGTSEQSWLDFGHLNAYFQSRTKFTTQRHFNNLEIKDGLVIKSSSDKNKIQNESLWYEKLPAQFKVHTPRLLWKESDDRTASYCLEYLHHISLSELFVFGCLKRQQWQVILNQIFKMLTDFRNVSTPEKTPQTDFVVEKTLQRLHSLGSSTGISIQKEAVINGKPQPSLLSLADKYAQEMNRQKDVSTFWHGDFCLSNLLFDFRINRLYMLDPRASNLNGDFSYFGHLSYDIAKLMHSFLGMYDHIVYDQYDLTGDQLVFKISQASSDVQAKFSEMVAQHFPTSEQVIFATMMHLFLSMLPLHTDNPKKLKALVHNIYRLDNLQQNGSLR